MKKLGIIGAMTVEVETLKAQMEGLQVTAKAGMEFFEGKLNGLDVVVVVCGVGKVNAALCVQVLCDCFGVTVIPLTIIMQLVRFLACRCFLSRRMSC